MSMKISSLMILLYALILFLSFSNVNAQRGMNRKGGGGLGTGSKNGRMYDTNTEETISGTVVKVERITQTKGRSCGIHLMIKTTKETISVHLGPEWFIEDQDIKINVNDTLSVKGSRINYAGAPAIIAAEVVTGDQTLNLRDQSGIPVWSSGQRRR